MGGECELLLSELLVVKATAPWSIYRQKQRTTLFDSSDASKTPNHHGDGSHRDEQVGCRQGGKGRRQRGEVALGHREPDADAQDPTTAQLEERQRFQP